MLKELVEVISTNKNLLMLINVGIYILALFSVLSSSHIIFCILLTLCLIFLLLKNIFPAKYILIWALIFYFGVMNTSIRLKDTDELFNLAPANAVISGKILSIPQKQNEEKEKFFFQPNFIEVDGEKFFLKHQKLFVSLNTNEKLQRFESYEIKGRLAPPFKAGNPSQFDYGNYLRNYNTYALFYGKEFKKIDSQLTKSEKFLQWINNYRDRIISIHSEYMKSPNLEILGGIVFGDDAVSTPENIKQSFINSGLLHILAASGMNVAFIFSFFFLILSTLRINYKINICIGILTVVIYALMTGLGASVVRAALMLIFVLVGKLIDREAHSISLLSFVAFLMLVYNPMFINDVGFQLSFIVTFGLLIMTPYIIKSNNRFLNWSLGTIFIPIIAQLWVMPVQIFYFNNISLYSVFANIMSVPILSIISFGGFISSLLAGITPISHIICKTFDIILNPLISLLVNISDFWGQLPNSALHTTHPCIFQIIIYYSILICITGMLNNELRNKYFKMFKYSCGILIFVLLISLIHIPNNNLEIIAFDVGNADAFLIKTPQNKYMLIDTGKSGYNGGKTQAKMVILKYLKDKGIKNIENLIITHFDNDHCGGAVDIINDLNVENLYINSLDHNSEEAKNILKTAKNHNTKIVLAQNNQVIIDNDEFKVTNFIAQDCFENGDNDASIITLIKYGKFSMLFMGDAGINTFEKLKPSLPRNITVLKVGHHGAKNTVNKSMIKHLSPQIALISVGENQFGHPNIMTLKLLELTKILRTDKNNSVKFSVSHNTYNIYTYSPDKKKYIKAQINR